MPYVFQAQAYPGLSLARVRTLARIVDIGLGKKNPYSMGATPTIWADCFSTIGKEGLMCMRWQNTPVETKES